MIDLQHIQSDEIAKLAIVGRPNVGKSTLFNRLLGRRRAIIAATPGVTRDPISQAVNINGERCILIDTGGLSESREYLNSLIVEKSFSIIRDADIVLLLLDITGITPEDEQLIEHLRPFSDHILVAVNKVDNEQRLHLMSDYYGLGFSQLFPISAAHGIGCEELIDVLAERIQSINKTHNKKQPPPPDPSFEEECADENSAGQQEMSITILGQPNTGKSTLSNFLSKGEHSIVTPTAGTTRDVLKQHCVYKGHHFSLLDTAGIRRKNKVHDDLEYYSVNRAIAAIEESQIIFLMIDAEKNLSDQDKKIAFQAVKHGRGVIIVLNKWDLIENLPNRLQAVSDRIRFIFPILHFAPILPLSAKTGEGMNQLMTTADRLLQQLRCRAATPILNKKLKDWMQQTPPPSNKGVRPKIKYIVQAGNLPMKFILFVNRKKNFPDSYTGYIKNCIRTEFTITEIPIRMELRESGRSR